MRASPRRSARRSRSCVSTRISVRTSTTRWTSPPVTLELLALETATIKGRTFEALRKLLLAKGQSTAAGGHRRRALDRPHVGGVPDRAGRRAAVRPGSPAGDLPPWLQPPMARQVVRDPDRPPAALAGRPANRSSQQSSARRTTRPRGSSVGARETPSSSRNSLEPHDSTTDSRSDGSDPDDRAGRPGRTNRPARRRRQERRPSCIRARARVLARPDREQSGTATDRCSRPWTSSSGASSCTNSTEGPSGRSCSSTR